MPNDWNKVIIIPIYKKGNRLNCNNYRSISLLNTTHKIFSKIQLELPQPIADERFGEYQCGFRKYKSTIGQLSVIEQIMEKKYEYRKNLWQVFMDFNKAYDSIKRDSLHNIMYEFGFPKTLIRLLKMCMENTLYPISTRNALSETFEVVTGLKQDDTLSPLLFNISL